MSRPRFNIVALLLGLLFLLLALAHAHLTIATEDMRAYRPVLIRAAVFAFMADACFVVLLVGGGMLWRVGAALLILLTIDVFVEVARRAAAVF